MSIRVVLVIAGIIAVLAILIGFLTKKIRGLEFYKQGKAILLLHGIGLYAFFLFINAQFFSAATDVSWHEPYEFVLSYTGFYSLLTFGCCLFVSIQLEWHKTDGWLVFFAALGLVYLLITLNVIKLQVQSMALRQFFYLILLLSYGRVGLTLFESPDFLISFFLISCRFVMVVMFAVDQYEETSILLHGNYVIGSVVVSVVVDRIVKRLLEKRKMHMHKNRSPYM